jgi:hypothetical protein
MPSALISRSLLHLLVRRYNSKQILLLEEMEKSLTFLKNRVPARIICTFLQVFDFHLWSNSHDSLDILN